MLLTERKQRKIFKMLNAGDSVRKIAKTVHVAQSTVQEYKKIYVALKAGKPLPPSVGTSRHSSRIQSILALGYELPIEQPCENPRNDPPPATDAPTNNQNIALWLSRDLEQSEKKIKELEEKVKQVTDERDIARAQVQDLILKGKQPDPEKEQLRQRNIELTSNLEAAKLEIQELRDTGNKQRDFIEKMKRDHQRELLELNEKANQENLIMQQEHNKELLKIKDIVTTMNTKNSDLEHDKQVLIAERDKYKSEVWSLTMKQKNAPIITATVGVVCVGIGAAAGWWLRGENNNLNLPVGNEEGNNTGPVYEIIPILEEVTIQPNIHHTTSGVMQEVNPSGTLYSGAVYQHNGATYGTQYHISSHQDNHGATQGTIIPGSQCSGVCMSTDITVKSFQEVTPIQAYSQSQIPPNYIPLYVPLHPLPSELSGTILWIPIMRMSGHQFEAFIQWVFEQLGYTVTRMKKTHDKGGDILIEGFGEKIIIQARHRKEHTGTDALQAVIFAKKMYGATKARVISISPFTADAIRDAPKAEIELWDLARFITELHNHSIYYPIE